MKCHIEGCNNKRALRRTEKNGTPRYFRVCSFHRNEGKKLKVCYCENINGIAGFMCLSNPEARGIIEKILEIHHINRNKGNELWNLITLCPNCHSEVHRLQGGNTTNFIIPDLLDYSNKKASVYSKINIEQFFS